MNHLHKNLRATVKRMLPVSAVSFIRGLRRPRVNFGDLGGSPISRDWGFDRGTVIDRYYMERYLSEHQGDIRGRVLEIEHDWYTRKFGSAVTHSDVLYVWPDCPRGKHATIIDDLTIGAKLESSVYDCIILTQTLPFIYDLHKAIQTIYRILKPGGVVLATVPSITKVSRDDMNRWGDYWRFTTQSLARLFEESFGGSQITTQSYGNVQIASAFLYGLSIQDLKAGALEHCDPDYPVSIALRAQKAASVLSQPCTVESVDNEAVLVRAFDGEIFYCNPSTRRLYGWDEAEMVGQVSHQVLSTTFPAPLPAIEDELISQGYWQGMLLHTRRDGSRVSMMSEWQLWRDSQAHPIVVVEKNTPASTPVT